MKIGFIGVGQVGQKLGSLFNKLGHEVAISSSRSPEALADTATQIGAQAMTVNEVMTWGDIIVLSTPMNVVPSFATNNLQGKILVDTNNYGPIRDGDIQEILDGKPTTQWVSEHFPGARIVKAFNNIMMNEFDEYARPKGAVQRFALPVCSDDNEAKVLIMNIIEDLGYDAYDAGSIAESWRQQSFQPAYCIFSELPELKQLLAEAELPIPSVILKANSIEETIKIFANHKRDTQQRADAMALSRKA
ncbi:MULTISPECIES: NAD(P)-binding domain-containing protein [Peribacillus]|uniref:NADPH-dependent F420 reductase n=1 Tax=Peribacillus frigoritolerans TaxID=450367 RepID=UPI003DA16347